VALDMTVMCGCVGGWRLVSEMQERWKDASRGKNIDSQSARNSQPLELKVGRARNSNFRDVFPPPPAEQQAIIHTHPAIFFVLSRRYSRYASQVTGQHNLIGKYSR